MSTLSTLGISISNALNAMYVDTVDTNDMHISLIFIRFSIHKKF